MRWNSVLGVAASCLTLLGAAAVRASPAADPVIPGLCHDMHDCPKSDADAWLRAVLDGYIGWAERHNSLLVLTFDEDDRTDGNHIPTVVLGEHVAAGDRPERIDHYSILRTIQEWYGLPPLGESAGRAPLPLR
ncbi:alkaline phosphatase family protein [Dactylosporangium sp. NPDC049742]|uniref:alkaline phosphatase family protein n=1 Tax=Dactylosporangium sp. NPDC049742 TaxID=3154737 RepID=UPI003425A004